MGAGAIAGYVIGGLLVFALCFGIAFAIGSDNRKKAEGMREVSQTVNIGDRIEDVVLRLGHDYTLEIMRNGERKYTWKIQSATVGYHADGMSAYSHSGVKRLTVYAKDGLVTAVSGTNLD